MKANNPLLVSKFLTFNKNANYFSKILPNDFSYQFLEKKYHHATFHKQLIIDTHKGQQ